MANTKKKTTKKRTATRAKKSTQTRDVNKSEAIRKLKAKKPSMGPKAIAETLTKQGIKVSPAFVSTVLSNSKKKGKSKGAGRRAGSGAIAVDDLVRAKKLVEKMGSIDRAQSALSALARLQ
jgi:hypothetical protein